MNEVIDRRDANDRRKEGDSALAPGRLMEPPFKAMRHIAGVLDAAFACMDARAEGREKPIATPWPELNLQLPGGGYWPGCHVVVGGTGAGKSAWAMQLSLHAARNGSPVVYVGLELDESQIALRLAGEMAKVGWSRLYTGEATLAERQRAREAKLELAQMPIHIESGNAMGWPASRIEKAVAEVRESHPAAPILLIVDFLQLVGAEADAGRQDLRERIGRAAYVAREAARKHGATVLLVSSVSRENYARVAGPEILAAAGLAADRHDGVVVERYLTAPDAIVGLGKESGEIEYAADSVSVMVSLPRVERRAVRAVVFILAKVRAGRPSWCSFLFDGFRFAEDPTHGRVALDAIDGLRKSRAGASQPPPGPAPAASPELSRPPPYKV